MRALSKIELEYLLAKMGGGPVNERISLIRPEEGALTAQGVLSLTADFVEEYRTRFVSQEGGKWYTECETCNNGFTLDVVTPGEPNPHPAGVFCPECKGKYMACPVLHFELRAPEGTTPATLISEDKTLMGDHELVQKHP